MALKTRKKSAQVYVDPLSITADIEVLSGNAVQTFNRETQEYVPDRTLVPVILMPKVVASDPHGVQNGEQTITAVEWYEGVPKADASNRIVANTDYEIGDGTVAGFPKFALKSKKNISCDTPMEIFCVAIFTDKRKNTEIKVERSKKLYTSYYDAQNFSLKIDKPKGWTINPLDVVPDAEGYWKHTISVQLYSGKSPVQDAHAVYWWEVYDKGTWRAVSDDDLSLWLDCKDAAGNFTKTLTFDARLIDGEQAFRARAAYFDTTKPQNPTSEELQVTTNVKLEMPKSLSVETIQTKGIRILPDMSTPVGYELIINYNKNLIGTEKDHLFQIEWFAASEKPGTPERRIGMGRTVEFVPKNLNFDPAYSIAVYASVKLYAGHAPVTIAGATPDAPPTFVALAGVPVIQATFV